MSAKYVVQCLMKTGSVRSFGAASKEDARWLYDLIEGLRPRQHQAIEILEGSTVIVSALYGHVAEDFARRAHQGTHPATSLYCSE